MDSVRSSALRAWRPWGFSKDLSREDLCYRKTTPVDREQASVTPNPPATLEEGGTGTSRA